MLRLDPVVFKFLGFKGTVILVVCVGAYGLFTGNIGNTLGLLGLQQSTTVIESTQPLRETAEEKELVGLSDKIHAACNRLSKVDANKLSVRAVRHNG